MNATDPSLDRLEPPTSVALWVAAGLAIPAGVDSRLRAGGVVLEVGCGGGLGCLALAEAYPSARIVGHDRDPGAIARARALALAAGLQERVTFVLTDSERLPRATFDLATLQALSARRDAVAVLNAVRNALVPEGICVLVEPPARFARYSARGRAPADALQAAAARAGFSRFTLLSRGNADIYALSR